jgi:hypothetical protein
MTLMLLEKGKKKFNSKKSLKKIFSLWELEMEITRMMMKLFL